MSDDFVHLDGPPDDEVAQLLRAALHAEAAEVTPHDRFADVLDQIEELETRQDAPLRGGRLRWLSIAAVAALALGVAVPLILGQLRGDQEPPATTVSPIISATTAPSPSGEASLPTTQRRLAVYYLGADQLLYREFRDLPTQSDRLTTAIAAVLNVAPYDPAYRSAWAGGQVNSATLTGNRIVIDLSRSAFGEFTDESKAELAIRQVVYTAIAAVGDRSGEKTVQILMDGSEDLPLIGRPKTDFVREGTAPLGLVWIGVPEAGQLLPKGNVVLSGYQQATMTDATLRYAVVKDGDQTPVAQGETEATGNDAGWRAWQIKAVLPPGQYTLTVTTVAGGHEYVRTFSVSG